MLGKISLKYQQPQAILTWKCLSVSNIYRKKSFATVISCPKKIFYIDHGLHKFVVKLDSSAVGFPFREVLTETSWLRRGPPKGSRYCDFQEVLRFLSMFRRKPKNIYQIYHSNLRYDIRKVYRYLRYCVNINLIEIDHIDEDRFLPAKYYRLTNKGRHLLEFFSGLSQKHIRE